MAQLFETMTDPRFGFGVAVGVGISLLILVGLYVVMPWLSVTASGVAVPFPTFLGMRIRRTPVKLVFDAHVALIKAGEQSDLGVVEATYLTRRNEVRTAEDLVRLVRQVRPQGDS